MLLLLEIITLCFCCDHCGNAGGPLPLWFRCLRQGGAAAPPWSASARTKTSLPLRGHGVKVQSRPTEGNSGEWGGAWWRKCHRRCGGSVWPRPLYRFQYFYGGRWWPPCWRLFTALERPTWKRPQISNGRLAARSISQHNIILWWFTASKTNG